jgi:hypothetical protein
VATCDTLVNRGRNPTPFTDRRVELLVEVRKIVKRRRRREL